MAAGPLEAGWIVLESNVLPRDALVSVSVDGQDTNKVANLVPCR